MIREHYQSGSDWYNGSIGQNCWFWADERVNKSAITFAKNTGNILQKNTNI